ncbi:MAG: CHAT domain-containing tetratricopeptide repeat protein, partial [Planctomycetota bacterium]
QLFGDAHPALVDTLLCLAQTHAAGANFAQAEAQYRQALDICREVFGPKDPNSLTCLNNLAELYHANGDYARAEPLLREVLEAYETVHGGGHPHYATALNNLAGLYQSMGDYARAGPLFEQALDIYRKAFGEKHPDYASGLNNLAGLYYQTDDYTRAEPLYRQAMEIRKEVLGQDHPHYADSLDNLAALYESMGDRARAEPFYRQALKIRKGTFGEKHAKYADSLNNLAGLYRAMEDYDRAEPLYREALEVSREALGTNHPDYAASLNNLAVLYRSTGDYDRAEPLYREAIEIQHRILSDTFAVLSERQQLAMTRSLRRTLDGYLSVTTETEREDHDSYRSVLAWKGMVFMRQRQTRLAAARPELAPRLSELESTAAQLAALVFSRPDPAEQEACRRRIAELSEKKERLEAELARAGAEAGTSRAEITAEQLMGALPRDVALVDFLEYAHSLPAAGEKGGEAPMPRHLVAFVLRPGRPVARLNLGPVAPIRSAIDVWRRTFGQAGKGAEAASELRRLLWQPLEEFLTEAETVLVSPDGSLARFPFCALPGKKTGTYLLEEQAMAVIPVPQSLPDMLADVTSPRDEATDASQPALLLLGDIDYDAAPPTSPGEGDAAAGSLAERHEAMQFTPLDSSRGEVLAVRDSFGRAYRDGRARLLFRQQATEAAFRREAPRHEFLHVATHGFFAPPEWSSLFAPAGEDGRGRTPTEENPLPGRDVTALHPGLLSGLALAGANVPHRPGLDNGILTAEEVAALDLEHVELAVLSACETGLGPVAGGEGVLGLQRAFQVSGTRTVVASLWKVSDEATRLLMERFYENLWGKKLGKLEALREAQLSMLREDPRQSPTLLAEGPQRGLTIVTKNGPAEKPRGVPPYYWAAFVLSGDWR